MPINNHESQPSYSLARLIGPGSNLVKNGNYLKTVKPVAQREILSGTVPEPGAVAIEFMSLLATIRQ